MQKPTIHEKYEKRPEDLNDICFAQFAISYDNCARVPKKTEWQDGVSIQTGCLKKFGQDVCLPRYIKLEDGTLIHNYSTS